MSEAGWSWDPSLYAGSAAYYVQGRVPYTQELVDGLVPAGFNRPTRIEVPGPIVVRSVDDIVASVFSLSRAAPHLFGDRGPIFEAELRELLAHVSPEGRFSEQMRETAIDLWHV